MKKQWRFRDIIDLEYFIELDDVQTKDERLTIRQRDRQIFLDEFPEADRPPKKIDRQILLAAWLKKRRQQEGESQTSFLPGQVVEDVASSARLLFALAGLIIGLSTTFSLLRYTGREPVNVFFYLSFIVLAQILLIALLPLVVLIKKRGLSFFPFGLLYSLSAHLIIKLFHRAKRQIITQLSAKKRDGLESILGLVNNKRQRYNSLFFWPVFLLFQLFGICFNVAVLLTTLFLIMASDIAFGWQSTIQLGSRAVHTLVRYLAIPWTWLLSTSYSHPSLKEIEGSRIILKDGIYSLATTDLVSWWPFLVLCVFVYGLLPRIVFFTLGSWAQNLTLKKLNFEQNIFSSLIQRMTTPVVSSSGSPLPDSAEVHTDSPAPITHEQLSRPISGAVTVLVPDDIYELCDDEQLSRHLLDSLGFTITEKIRIDNEYQAEQQLIDDLGNTIPQSNHSLLILTEGWMAPIEDFLSFLKNMRAAIGKQHPIYIALLGKPDKSTLFTPVSELDLQIWQRKLNSLGDPYLSVQPIDSTR